MNDRASKSDDGRTVYHQPNWNVGTVNQKVVVQSGPVPVELTPEQLAAVEARYRAQVVERYNRLGFAGLGISGSNLSELPLDDVFVRLTLTVEKTVREEGEREGEEREDRRRGFWRMGGGKEEGVKVGERPRERTITVQEPITLGDALAQHALIVGEPGAGKSTLLRWTGGKSPAIAGFPFGNSVAGRGYACASIGRSWVWGWSSWPCASARSPTANWTSPRCGCGLWVGWPGWPPWPRASICGLPIAVVRPGIGSETVKSNFRWYQLVVSSIQL